MNDPDARIEDLSALFRHRGARAYLGEPVTVADHMLQCAALAQAQGAPEPLVAAALLHDVGHLTGAGGEYTPHDTADRRHEAAGAERLLGFPAVVVESVRLHVAAKRYLCAVDPGYHGRLTEASRHSLILQGGPMDAEARAAFEANAFHREALQLRRWDDGGKTAGRPVAAFDLYRPLLRRVLECGMA